MTRRALTVAVLVLVVALPACGDDDAPSPASAARSTGGAAQLAAQIPAPGAGRPQAARTFVGRVAASTLQVAVVVRQGSVVAYVCDGRSIGRWMTGSADGSRLVARAEDGSTLRATLAGGRVQGRVHLAGASARRFSAVGAEGGRGLFRRVRAAGGRREVLGWILTRAGLTGVTDTDSGPKQAVATTTTTTAGDTTQTSAGSTGPGTTAPREPAPVLGQTTGTSCGELEAAIDKALQNLEFWNGRTTSGFNENRKKEQAIKFWTDRLNQLSGQGCE